MTQQQHGAPPPAKAEGDGSPLDSTNRKSLSRGLTHADPQDHRSQDGPALRQPHERDESSDSQALANAAAAAQGRRGYQDQIGEQVDTDKGPVLDAVYNEKVVPPHGRS